MITITKDNDTYIAKNNDLLLGVCKFDKENAQILEFCYKGHEQEELVVQWLCRAVLNDFDLANIKEVFYNEKKYLEILKKIGFIEFDNGLKIKLEGLFLQKCKQNR